MLTSQTIAYKKQIQTWKEKYAEKEDLYDNVEEKLLCSLQNEKLLQQENSLLVTELQTLKRKIEWRGTEVSTQTAGDESHASKELMEKMNEIMDAVQSDKLSISQLDSQKKSYSRCTQTSPNKVWFIRNEKSIQTDELTDESGDKSEGSRNEKSKRKQKLTNETQRLLLLKSDLNQENRSLKKRVLSLENQVGSTISQ